MNIRIFLKLGALIGLLALALVGVMYGIAPLLPGASQLGYSSESRFYVMDVGRGIQHPLLDDPAQPWWSPDGEQMAFIRHAPQLMADRVMIAQMYTSGPQVMYPAEVQNGVVLHSPAWSPFDSRLAFTYLETGTTALQLVVLEPDTGSARRERISGGIPAGSILNWTGANRLRYVSVEKDRVRLNELRLNEVEPVVVREWPFPTVSTRQAVLSADGSHFILPAVAPNNLNFELYLFDTDVDAVRNLTNRRTHNDTNPVWSPDEQRILFRSLTDSGQYLVLMNTDGSEQQTLFHVREGLLSQVQWSPDGEQISYVLNQGGHKRLCIFRMTASTVNCPAQGVDQASWRPNS